MSAQVLRRGIEGHLNLADDFVHRVRTAPDPEALRLLLDGFANELGFRHYAIIHHDDLRVERPGLINLQNYPDVWADHFIGQRLYLEDPVVHASLRTSAAFTWAEVADLLPLTERHRDILRGGAREGLERGITVPCHVPGEPTGSCTLAGPRRGMPIERYLSIAQLVGAFSFQAARRLVSGNALRLARTTKITPRQRECVLLAGQGKSNWEIARILGLSPVTVNRYFDDARRRYDVTSRTQLVIGALLDGELSLLELAPDRYSRMTR